MFWAVNELMALPNEKNGTVTKASTLIAAEYPASTFDPKPLTTLWTSIMPIEMDDCWTIDGTDMASILPRDGNEKRPLPFPQVFWIIFTSTADDMTAERAWAKSVAQAAPATPMPRPATAARSRTTLSTDEKMRSTSGMDDRPIELNSAEITL